LIGHLARQIGHLARQIGHLARSIGHLARSIGLHKLREGADKLRKAPDKLFFGPRQAPKSLSQALFCSPTSSVLVVRCPAEAITGPAAIAPSGQEQAGAEVGFLKSRQPLVAPSGSWQGLQVPPSGFTVTCAGQQ
jgi:hypothetical protein